MKSTTTMIALVGTVSARELFSYNPISKRQVPGEHAHQDILDIVNPILQSNNPLEIQDVVFALLGNKAAAEGAPNVDNLDCLQQIIADQVFSTAKADGNLEGQANALIFRALERNTGSVGLASVLCNEQAENPEVAALQQHQDAASPEGKAGNADLELELARQLAALGADPLLALGSGTFAAGDPADPTGAGFTCDDPDDKVGCINSLGLLTPAVSEAEILAAVEGIAAGGNNAAAGNAKAAEAACAAAGNAKAGAANANKAEAAGNKANANAEKAGANNANANAEKAGANNANANANQAATGTVDVNAFNGNLGSAAVPIISSAANADRPFEVNGATFVNLGAAVQRACDVQANACANAANSGQLDANVGDCNDQRDDCQAANSAGAKRAIGRKHRRQAALDTGSCGSPAILFGDDLGRNELAFAAANQKDFNHGAALNIGVISDFVCQQLENKCKAAQETIDACDAANQAARAEKGQASADAFNNALGVSA